MELEERVADDFDYTDYVDPGDVKKAHKALDCNVIIFQMEKGKFYRKVILSDGFYRKVIFSDGFGDFSFHWYVGLS